ncbi:hypothetical protein B0D71_04885 [Pseudomonas laurylsulfativorans]|uniref:Uncharacterized protein n=2 Tax=Pseudomonas laurylsulfativorans TaxID=1943631 RepID=A0A2S3VW33_9PSED|nr:hypothetical protein B0D71_04885 [Pseudomonas laurylsulfativorans]
MASLLVSVAVSANGVIPVLELDFTRSATETLKKIGINDACIIGASNPVAFTYCREGSTTLWKYQALDLEQMAVMRSDAKQPLTNNQPISVIEFNSAACEHENSLAAAEKPATARWLILGLIAMSLLIGLRYSYGAMLQRRQNATAYSQPDEQAPSEFQATAQTKALAAFGLAVAVAVVYFNYTGY